MKHTRDQLILFQNMPLDIKIAKSKLRIQEWYEAFDGDVYISFSGGKDSTVLLHLVRSLYPNVVAVFIDTGLEYPEIRKFTKGFENVIPLKPKKAFKEVIQVKGYPIISKEVARAVKYARKNEGKSANHFVKKLNGELIFNGEKSRYNMSTWKFLLDAPFKISSDCCDEMKKKPFKEFEKASGLKPFVGTMASESRQRNQAWLKTGCNAFESKNQVSKPLSFWTEQDILKYIKMNNLDIAEVYGEVIEKDRQTCMIEEITEWELTGCSRTGCMFCMFGCHLEKPVNRFETMKLTHPKQYDYCMRSFDEGGLGLAKVLDYINVTY